MVSLFILPTFVVVVFVFSFSFHPFRERFLRKVACDQFRRPSVWDKWILIACWTLISFLYNNFYFRSFHMQWSMLEQVFSCQKKEIHHRAKKKFIKKYTSYNGTTTKRSSKRYFLLWKENEWWRHMLRLFIHIYGVFHSVQLYTRLRTKYFTMDRNWMNIVKKSNNETIFCCCCFRN